MKVTLVNRLTEFCAKLKLLEHHAAAPNEAGLGQLKYILSAFHGQKAVILGPVLQALNVKLAFR
jgi:hypothetical protein